MDNCRSSISPFSCPKTARPLVSLRYLDHLRMVNYANLDGNALMKLIRSNDELAFTEVYNRYWEQLLAVAFHFTRSKQSAEDVLQEVMLSLWTRRSQLQVESANAYLATAVKFSVFKIIAREKRHREIEKDLPIQESISDIEEKLDTKFWQDYINGEVEQFADKTKLIFTYRTEDDLSITEIAEKMDLSPKSIEYHLTKAMQALRNTVKKIKILFV